MQRLHGGASQSRRSDPLPAQAKPASTDTGNVGDRFHNVNYVIHFTNRATFVATFSGLKLGFSPLLFLLNAAGLLAAERPCSVTISLSGHLTLQKGE